MVMNQYSRTELILGQESLDKLWNSTVAIFGVGGVGGNVVESLARAGVGHFVLVDDDLVCLTNLNRQILATRKTYGQHKVDVAEERIHDINPKIEVIKHKTFYLPENRSEFDFKSYDYVVDALDTVTAKIDIICTAKENNAPVISAMGCGNRVDPTKLKLADIYETSNDPLSKVMRYELRKRKIKSLNVVYSTELPIRPNLIDDKNNSCLYNCVCPPGTTRNCTQRRDIPGSTSFVPPAAGILIGYKICMDLTGFDAEKKVKEQLEIKKNKKLQNKAKQN